MREIRTKIDIAAPAAIVWDILLDFNRWGEWNPIVKRAHGVATIGTKLDITMCREEGKEGKDGPRYMPIVTDANKPSFFRFRVKMMAGFIFTNDKVFELEDTSSGSRLVHKELYGGIMAKLFWSKLDSSVPSMLNSMNEALKKLAEKNSS